MSVPDVVLMQYYGNKISLPLLEMSEAYQFAAFVELEIGDSGKSRQTGNTQKIPDATIFRMR